MELTVRYGLEFNPFLKNSKEILYTGNDLIDVFLRGNAFFDRLCLDLLSVLIGTCQKHDVISLKSFETRHGICHGRAVSVSDMQI